MEAFALLLRYSPLIKAKIFMGKGAITQKQQLDVNIDIHMPLWKVLNGVMCRS